MIVGLNVKFTDLGLGVVHTTLGLGVGFSVV